MFKIGDYVIAKRYNAHPSTASLVLATMNDSGSDLVMISVNKDDEPHWILDDTHWTRYPYAVRSENIKMYNNTKVYWYPALGLKCADIEDVTVIDSFGKTFKKKLIPKIGHIFTMDKHIFSIEEMSEDKQTVWIEQI